MGSRKKDHTKNKEHRDVIADCSFHSIHFSPFVSLHLPPQRFANRSIAAIALAYAVSMNVIDGFLYPTEERLGIYANPHDKQQYGK